MYDGNCNCYWKSTINLHWLTLQRLFSRRLHICLGRPERPGRIHWNRKSIADTGLGALCIHLTKSLFPLLYEWSNHARNFKKRFPYKFFLKFSEIPRTSWKLWKKKKFIKNNINILKQLLLTWKLDFMNNIDPPATTVFFWFGFDTLKNKASFLSLSASASAMKP